MRSTVWQLIDSAFPVGGFAHSAGLESTLAHGVREPLEAYATRFVRQLERGALPFVNAAYARPEALAHIDARYEAFVAQHVARRASALQGRALLVACKRIFGGPEIEASHLAPLFGAVCAWLQIDAEETRAAYVFTGLRGLLSAAVRLGVAGPYEAQALQHRLAPICQEVVVAAQAHDLDAAAQTAPMLDVFQGAHDRLYSRLFQS